MQRSILLLLLAFLTFSCGSQEGEATDEASTADTTATTAAPADDPMANIAPPPPQCVYLTEAEVLNLFPAGVQMPMPAQRAASSYNSCQYTLDATEWSAGLVLEMPEEENEIQAIRDEVAGAKGKDALKVMDFPARILNDGRIIAVEASKPFRVKFSALPKEGFPEAFDAAARRAMIVKLAEATLQ